VLAVPAAGDPDEPPPRTFCETHIGLPAPRCLDCVPGLYVCPLHLVECRGEGHLCCPFCRLVQCSKHIDCSCVEAVARRLQITVKMADEAARSVAAAAHRARLAAQLANGAVHRVVSGLVGSVPVPAPAPVPVLIPVAPVVAGPVASVPAASFPDLSEYDVSMFLAHQLFAVVNLPETLSQYNQPLEEGLVEDNTFCPSRRRRGPVSVSLDPCSDVEPGSDNN
jgi:hypothetical protein